MNKKMIATGILSLLVLPALSFADGKDVRSDKQLKCANTVGKSLVEVNVKVVNDADSGIKGNYWALDALNRHITVWKTTTAGVYCATVQDDGKFKTIAGQVSPGGTATLTGKEKGEIEGGYVATITGTLLANPTWKTRGDIGTIDYKCDVTGACPGYVSWVAQYFTAGYGFDQPSWGWVYRGGKYGTWVNAITGNTGDIVPAKADADNKENSNNENSHGDE